MFIVPASRTGTPFQHPSWRYQVAEKPGKFDLTGLICTRNTNNASLKRVAIAGAPCRAVFHYPDFLEHVCARLTPRQAWKLKHVYRGKARAAAGRKIAVENVVANGQPIFSWNIPAIRKLKDNTLRRYLLHAIGVTYDRQISWAIDFRVSPGNQEIVRMFGRAVFAGISDEVMAKDWKLTVEEVRLLKDLFFDFTGFPSGRQAVLAMLRQLGVDGFLDEEDFQMYKRIFDIGPISLRIETDLNSMSPEELAQVNRYVHSRYVANVLNLNTAIRDKQDALDFHNVTTGYAKMLHSSEYLNQLKARTKYFEVMVKRAEQELGEESLELQAEDRQLLDFIQANALKDHEFKPRTIGEISVENIQRKT